MKKLIVAVAGALLLALTAIALSQEQTSDQTTVTMTPTLPASLEQFYPPKSAAPVFLLEMHALSRPLTGMICDLTEGDMENAHKNFAAFKEQYVKASALVPEWSHMYPLPPVEQLGEALKSGNQGQVMGAVMAVGQACNTCHRSYMPAVQHEYHWGDFDAVTVEDPLSKTTVPFAQLMLMMETSMGGVSNDLQQGQLDNARRQLQGFEARFNAMSQTCVACHDTERKYYVDNEVTSIIQSLKTTLAADTFDPKQVASMFERIGQESCTGCHLVHIPAAYAKKTAVRM